MELRTVHTPTGGCSREYSTMGESLIERRRVQEEGFRPVNCFSRGGTSLLLYILHQFGGANFKTDSRREERSVAAALHE